MLKSRKLKGNEKMELAYFCYTCYRWFKTPQHFTRYSNQRHQICPVTPPKPEWRCKVCGKTYNTAGWATKHICKEA